MSATVARQKGFSMVEVLLAMMLMVLVVTALAGYHRVLASRFVTLEQYRQLWRHVHAQSQLSAGDVPSGWQVNRMQTTQAGCVSISVKLISPLGRQGQMTRLHCPVSQ
ncbi:MULTISPECIES: prepilin-type N-terminal cleavage/methylation domain-containing protein [unclassified Leclercia]|uniref:Prepilin-type N-terminal cleavage/methylation domain-containing protein n=1 Tax=Leclercia barmai TaxID=2785629 RepID=A0ABS7RZR7_9ENTR|nr:MULTISPECIES: prepilin-type N-terminal cleavage/methylation domain-containing protein [unclassified Leclercia]MBZ0059800.1 prepilin-type N-terminal cleavage/methylation domain-containing protein [Leclercia sp. EMC7]MCM5695988.1 prepilin-type N-terminal cleavage/methylation domain-containing protein [Leclercia sp. LTM01]MCM5701627.1 prepilin-type N-terminal cleavage/methylation domain-containing protein [Leclercia sp. LTM14]